MSPAPRSVSDTALKTVHGDRDGYGGMTEQPRIRSQRHWGRSRRSLPAAFLLVGLLISPACHDPAHRTRRAKRDRNMTDVLEWYADYDSTAPDRSKWLEDIGKTLRAQHEKQLAEMLRQIEGYDDRDWTRWDNSTAQREAWLESLGTLRSDEMAKAWDRSHE